MLLVRYLVSQRMFVANVGFTTVLAEYLFKLADADTTAWKEKGVAVAAYTVAVLSMYCPGRINGLD